MYTDVDMWIVFLQIRIRGDGVHVLLGHHTCAWSGVTRK